MAEKNFKEKWQAEKQERMKIPKKRLPYTSINLICDLLTLSLIIYMFVIANKAFQELPDLIGTHFNAIGEIDGYGSKEILFISPISATVLAVLLSIFNIIKIRWYVNFGDSYPIEYIAVNEEHKEFIYKSLSNCIAMMKVFFAIMMLDPLLSTANQKFTGFVLFGISIGCFIATPIVMFILCYQKGKKIMKRLELKVDDENITEENTEDEINN